MKKLLFGLLAILFLPLFSTSQILDPVKWTFKTEQTTPGEATLILIARAEKKWHVYSQDIPKGGPIPMGNVGAGAGAVAGGLKGGLGTASQNLGDGVMVGAIVATNAGGSPVNPATGELYAAYLEVAGEFGGLKRPLASITDGAIMASVDAMEPVKNTTIACIATNVKLTKAQAQKIAEMAHDGMARAIRPSHTMFDGDTIFVLGTGLLDLATLKQVAVWGNEAANVSKLGAAAADVLARAIVHAVLNAKTVGTTLSYRDKFPAAFAK